MVCPDSSRCCVAHTPWVRAAILLFAFACSRTGLETDESTLWTGVRAGNTGTGTKAGAVGTGGAKNSSMRSSGGMRSNGGTRSPGMNNGTMPREKLACSPTSYEVALQPTRLYMVIDASSSMNRRPTGSTRTSWEVVQETLESSVLGTMTETTHGGFDPSMQLGLLTYPNLSLNSGRSLTARPIEACINVAQAVPLAALGDPESMQRGLLSASLLSTTLEHGTPTADAYTYARNQLDPGSSSWDAARSHILLVTDGSPSVSSSCINPNTSFLNVDAKPIVDSVIGAAVGGVHTHVIGLPGSEASRDWLSEAAHYGETGLAGCSLDAAARNYCHLDITTAPDFAGALRTALTEVIARVSPCVFAVPRAAVAGAGSDTAALQIESVALVHANGATRGLTGGAMTQSGCLSDYCATDGLSIVLSDEFCRAELKNVGARLRLAIGCGGD